MLLIFLKTRLISSATRLIKNAAKMLKNQPNPTQGIVSAKRFLEVNLLILSQLQNRYTAKKNLRKQKNQRSKTL